MVRMADVRACFVIEAGGALALTAVALLVGGDYNAGGADKVGHKQVIYRLRQRPSSMLLQTGCEGGVMIFRLTRCQAALSVPARAHHGDDMVMSFCWSCMGTSA